MTDVSKRDAANRALTALFVEVHEDVAKDVRKRIRAAFAEADAKVADLQADLDTADEDISWMSGSNDFATGGKAHRGWLGVRKRLNARLEKTKASRT